MKDARHRASGGIVSFVVILCQLQHFFIFGCRYKLGHGFEIEVVNLYNAFKPLTEVVGARSSILKVVKVHGLEQNSVQLMT